MIPQGSLRQQASFFDTSVTVILVAVIFIGQQVYEGLFVNDNVSNLSHIIGGIVGAAIGYITNRKAY